MKEICCIPLREHNKVVELAKWQQSIERANHVVPDTEKQL